MAVLKVVLHEDAVAEILTGDEIQALLAQRAKAIADAAGPGNIFVVDVGPNRARASVIAVSRDAQAAEADDAKLTSSIDAGRA